MYLVYVKVFLVHVILLLGDYPTEQRPWPDDLVLVTWSRRTAVGEGDSGVCRASGVLCALQCGDAWKWSGCLVCMFCTEEIGCLHGRQAQFASLLLMLDAWLVLPATIQLPAEPLSRALINWLWDTLVDWFELHCNAAEDLGSKGPSLWGFRLQAPVRVHVLGPSTSP